MEYSTNRLFIAAAIFALGFLVYLLQPVLMPFLCAALLAYVGDPLVDRLEKHKLPRTIAVICVFVGLFATLAILVGVLIPSLQHQLKTLFTKLPTYLEWLQVNVLPWMSANLNVDSEIGDSEAIKKVLGQYWQQAGSIAGGVLQALSASGLAFAGWLANLILIPVVTFYLLRDWDILVGKVNGLIPRQQEPLVSRLTKQSDEVLGEFVRGQLLVMLVLGIVYSLGLWLVGLDFSLLIGMTAGVVSFVPYLGFIVGIVLAGTAAILQFHDVFQLLPVLIVFGVGQALEGMLLTPLLVGDKIGLHPVAVIFAVMAGGQLFGFVGILLALPVAAVIVVLLRHVHAEYTASSLFKDVDFNDQAGDKHSVSPDERFDDHGC